ncbi:MAG TPA: CHRD domain-containing protein [Chloroflexota bacterium]|nr:CHRD domain-containing protein [Chloroflexota bacterium]
MRVVSILLGVALAVLSIGSAFAQGTVTVNLAPINGSGISGTAQLIDKGNQTEVVVNVTGEPAAGSEPMHIHSGQCGPTLGKVVHPLKNVEGGTSDTTVNATLASLQTGGFAINVHESAAKISTYVACGNIPALATTTSTAGLPKTGGIPTTAVVLLAGALIGVGYTLRRRLA